MRRLFVVLPLVFFAALAAVFALGLNRDPSLIPSMLINKPLPSFSLPSVRAGDPGLASQDFRGQPMLLNMFASWCVSCRVEHPLLLDLRSRGVAIAGIDWEDKPAAGAKYLKENGDPYARVGLDSSGRIGIDLGITGVPETFVVDKHGRVRYKQIGPIETAEWENTIRPLMDTLRTEP
ncbi:MAG TPA: DsbE family thiol:disulfide interchange protein [Rhizomicrobium sp.]|jgi:cytochrome c biogenesis protein CcmG/thiol:disulfide interchange protein DsbE|nr:DsbE family thiol:disulfide interchange protein [Rhizomicrobium sp.]